MREIKGLWSTLEAAYMLNLAQVSIRIYCVLYNVGRKVGRDWFLNKADIKKIFDKMQHVRKEMVRVIPDELKDDWQMPGG